MDVPGLIPRFAANAEAIAALVRGADPATHHWSQAPGKWTLVEIVMHLWDEEREDFKVRFDYTLHRPGEEWPRIDPQGWVTSRDYASRAVEEALTGFLTEREASLAFLRGLENPDLDASHTRDGWTTTAGNLLLSWEVHDLLHLRQITRLLYDHAVAAGKPYDSAYAGPWPGAETP